MDETCTSLGRVCGRVKSRLPSNGYRPWRTSTCLATWLKACMNITSASLFPTKVLVADKVEVWPEELGRGVYNQIIDDLRDRISR
ncbi:hypothetical protein RSOLAG22IIIB_13497 [Rhizoctonia solani]|uniref:Uncharacterized protein n=1 Tax=Rhizoctonia solani TaxID=456999 RepID=A0A0K6FMZ7_9AGAM|nr:hypothetical protein RSOLAG22IIIB_13497 [Rhizoctonia solani]